MSSQRLKLIAREKRKRAEAGVGGIARRLGYELRRQHFYLPFPDVERLPDLWTEPRDLTGVDLRLQEAGELLKELEPLIAEFSVATAARPAFLDNGGYESVDAEVLYGLLRKLKPARVVELGSGASSHVIDLARRANEDDGQPLTHTIYDPYPFGNPMGPVSAATVHALAAEDLDIGVIDALQAGDILFVDTTHTVKTGGDVVRIFLDLVPRLAAGAYVHVHDVFLPYEYPRKWVVDDRRAWAEQYLLQAFLAFNEQFEVVFPAYAISREQPALVSSIVPSFGLGVAPGAFWMRRAKKTE
jgi:hypothetical protein